MNCPIEFSNNCTNMNVKCDQCRAHNKKAKYLYYRPILKEPDLLTHPVSSDVDNDRVELAKRANRDGHKTERKNLKYIGATSTRGSGSVCGDGDGYIDHVTGRLRVEHKHRMGIKSTLGITSAEFKKGKRQGIDIYIIDSNVGRMVLMDIDILKRLLNE
jgi:hypothetical protein